MTLKLNAITAFATLAVSLTPGLAQQAKVTEYGAQPSTGSSKAAVTSDLAAYMVALERKIQERGPKKFIGQVAVTFTLDKDGAVSNIKLTKSSGMPQVDGASTAAVKSSAPFEALPSGAGKSVEIQVSFEGTSQASTCHAIRLH